MFLFAVGMIIAEYLRIIKEDFKENIGKNDFKNFSELIENHKKVIEMHEMLNQLYAPVIFERYISVALSISALGFDILTVLFWSHPFTNIFIGISFYIWEPRWYSGNVDITD
jgi:hypothetical protein